MADKSNATASRRDVTCDYCGKPYQKRFLKDHTERIHKGEKPRERHASGQKTIQFAVQGDKRPSESGETSSNAKVARIEEPDDDVELDELVPAPEENENEPVIPVTNVTNEDILKEIKLSTLVPGNMVTKNKTFKELEETNSKDLIKQFSTSPALYEGIELVLRATYEASIKLSVELLSQ